MNFPVTSNTVASENMSAYKVLRKYLLHRLEARVVAVFILLVLMLQTLAFFYITNAIDSNARSAVQSELLVGERVFRNLLEQNAQKLTSSARVLAADYAFREAVVVRDQATIASVLENHGERIGSAMTLLVGLDQTIVAQTQIGAGSELREIANRLSRQAQESGTASDIATVSGKSFQFVIVPIKAPITVGWVVMAFPLGESLVANLKNLSTLDATIITQKTDQTWQLNVSTLVAQHATQILDINMSDLTRSGQAQYREIQLEQTQVATLAFSLVREGGTQTVAVLARSVTDAVAKYQTLKVNLLLLTLIGIVIAIVTSAFFARAIVRPLRQLAEVAQRLGKGDYSVAIDIVRRDEIGELGLAFSHMRKDIAHREEAISRLAYWDTLTGLPNRVQFLKTFQNAIQESKLHDQDCYVLMMDLDRFKVVNDVMGHHFGDVLLTRVAERLSDEIETKENHLARLGGDEFAMVLPCATNDQAWELAQNILRALEKPICIEDQTVDLSAGIGIAVFPKDGMDAASLLIHAEVAMYVAKTSHSGAVYYRPEIDQASQLSLSLLSELRLALETNAFKLFAQPKIALRNNQVVAVEALVRWVHPERGMIFPDQFIPFSEQTGFIRLLTLWVVENAARACKTWLAQGLHLKVSVNLSTRDLLDVDLPKKILTILNQYQLVPENFCLEITESAIMDDPIRAQQTLDHLSELGFELSIDDFGTGYSSLAYLKRLPVVELKIDKSFVLGMVKDLDDTKIVRSTIDLGHNLGLRVVAEGVENQQIMNLLAELGCDQAQGYFMSKPIPVDQIAQWVLNWNQEKQVVSVGS